jgi:hypothetical protein
MFRRLSFVAALVVAGCSFPRTRPVVAPVTGDAPAATAAAQPLALEIVLELPEGRAAPEALSVEPEDAHDRQAACLDIDGSTSGWRWTVPRAHRVETIVLLRVFARHGTVDLAPRGLDCVVYVRYGERGCTITLAESDVPGNWPATAGIDETPNGAQSCSS